MSTKSFVLPVLVFAVLACAGCTAAPSAATPAASVPSPTIASVQSVAAPAPAPAPVAATATRPLPTRAALIATANPNIFSYLWPAYLPQGMVPMPSQSRIAKDTELGTNAAGFFLITFNANGGQQKIILGGGSVEPLALTGDSKQITLDGRKATLVTNGDQRLVRFDTETNQGSLFLFGIGVSEQELLVTAESLLPITPTDMRLRVGL